MSTQFIDCNSTQLSHALLPIILSGVHIPPETIDAIVSFLEINCQLAFRITCKAIYPLYHRFEKVTRTVLYNSNDYEGFLYQESNLDNKLYRQEPQRLINCQRTLLEKYTSMFETYINQNDWSKITKLEVGSVNPGETSQYQTMVLCLCENLYVPRGCENIIALALTFSNYPNCKPLPELDFFEQFPKLKFLVLQNIGLDERAMLTISQLTSHIFVYMHNCSTQEFGFGPFKDFESCENIRRLHLDGCSFNDNCLSFPSNLIELNVTKCSPFKIDVPECSHMESV
jgi:hypothetical protein